MSYLGSKAASGAFQAIIALMPPHDTHIELFAGSGAVLLRKPRDYDAELQALMDKAKKLKSQKTVQLGELVQVTGVDALPVEALAGALLAAVEQSKKSPEAVQRWAERGQALFRAGGKRGSSKAGTAEPAGGPPGDNGKVAAAGGAA